MPAFWVSPPAPETLLHNTESLLPTPKIMEHGEHRAVVVEGVIMFTTEGCETWENTCDKLSFICPDNGGMYTHYHKLQRTEIFFKGISSRYTGDASGAIHMSFEDGSQYERKRSRDGDWCERIDYRAGGAVLLRGGRVTVVPRHEEDGM